MEVEASALLSDDAALATGAAQGGGGAAHGRGDEAHRHELSDGVPRISMDGSLSPCSRRCIAGARTIVLWAICSSALYAVYTSRDLVIGERVWHNHVTLLASLCEDGGVIRSLDPEPLGFLDLVREEQRKIVTFEPVGPAAERLRLPVLRYYASEEFRAGGPRWSIGYSLGMFPQSELHFVVAVNDTDCLKPDPADGDLSMLLGMEQDTQQGRAVIRFGLAVVQMLEEAGRRTPHMWMATTPRFHGSMLIREDTDEVWEASSGIFGSPYVRSCGWQVYWAVMVALRVCVGVALHLLLGTWASREWHRAVDTWVVQYDRIWANRSLRGMHSAIDGCNAFLHRIQCCSTFFVLDHVTGDVQTNADDLIMGVMSSIWHGAIFVSVVILPNVMACFFSEWKPCVHILTGLHLVSAMAYGAGYYFDMRFRNRAVLLVMHLLCTLVSASFSLFYLNSVTLFVLTRPFVMPDEAMAYSVCIGTVVVYVAVVAHQLQRVREGLLDQLGGKESKGKVIGFLKYLGLDVRAIIFSVFGGALLVFFLALLILLAGEMYLTSGPWETLSTCFGTTCTAFGAMAAQLRQKQAAEEESASGIPSVVLDLV